VEDRGQLAEPHVIRGFLHYPGLLDLTAQERMVADVRAVVACAPLFSPETRYGKAMSVRMTSAGAFGWVSDRRGYRYDAQHPSGVGWPAIPDSILDVWRAAAGVERHPESCLINFYDAAARMGMHQDRDEASFDWPVVSISLGDDALFRIGGTERAGNTQSVWLRSGDVMVMGGPARLAHHGVDRIAPGTSTLLPKGGRINLTLRVVT
jgi:DNA oxidative demethylase